MHAAKRMKTGAAAHDPEDVVGGVDNSECKDGSGLPTALDQVPVPDEYDLQKGQGAKPRPLVPPAARNGAALWLQTFRHTSPAGKRR